MADSLRFITSIKYHKDLLQKLNNVTYIYDVNWRPDNTNKATFPVCFFHVKSNGQHEIMSSEISQKQMLFYNSSIEKLDSDPALNSGLLNVVADNIVIKPKAYKLDVIIPYSQLSLLDQSFVINTHSLTNLPLLIGQETNPLGYSSWATLSNPYVSFIKDIMRSLVYQNYNNSIDLFDIRDWISGTVQQPDFNKQSLEIMWRMRHIVKMKLWNSWEYVYLSIIDVDITKEGTEDGVYEATLTLQEVPMVTMYNQKNTFGVKFTRKNPLLEAEGKKVISLLNFAGGNDISRLGWRK
jgi:hypothetical protein